MPAKPDRKRRHPRHSFAPIPAAIVALSIRFVATADGFGAAVLDYVPGNAPANGFTVAGAALGEPTRLSGQPFSPGVVSPFAAAWTPTDVVSIGGGGSITIQLDVPATDDARHPFGVDLIVFGNSFFVDVAAPLGIAGGLVSDGGVIEVSPDGQVWHEVVGAIADGLWPTLAYSDAGPYDIFAGEAPTDFRTPMDPSLTLDDALGLPWEDLVNLYGGSGGGRGIDLASLGLSHAAFVRVRVPAGHPWHVELDAVARTREFDGSGPDLDGDGIVGGADVALLLGAFGHSADGDANGDGETDGADLALVLGAWS